MEQMFHGRLDWYLVKMRDTEDAQIEKAKVALKSSLDSLTETLADVHWPAHNDQSGEDYVLTDEQWADILRKAEEGKALASEKVSAVWRDNQDLVAAQEAWMNSLSRKIAQLDLSIARDS
ncbi:MAG: hypothetical protein ACK5SX_03120 [Sandaracinobacter sp.]